MAKLGVGQGLSQEQWEQIATQAEDFGDCLRKLDGIALSVWSGIEYKQTHPVKALISAKATEAFFVGVIFMFLVALVPISILITMLIFKW